MATFCDICNNKISYKMGHIRRSRPSKSVDVKISIHFDDHDVCKTCLNKSKRTIRKEFNKIKK